jgi:predicted nuclease of predicted toxin-antitoxin system
MKFLADENPDEPIVNWLHTLGVDLRSIRRIRLGMSDEEIMALARAEDRVIITNDLDFGELVFHRGMTTTGIILIRVQSPLPRMRLAALQQHWGAIIRHAPGNFVVVTENQLRIRPLE